MSATLELRTLSIGHRKQRLCEPINTQLNAGELCCALGANGAGKSTLLRTVAGLHPPLSGDVWVRGARLGSITPQERARRVAVVFTDRPDAGLLRVRELVALGRHPHTGWNGMLTDTDHAHIQRAMEMTGVSALAAREAGTLSDGERQRVMLARALAQDSPLLVLDEPTAFLDLGRRAELMQLLRALAHDTGKTILLSTHDLDLALRCADQFWLLAQGRLQCGMPETMVLNNQLEKAFVRPDLSFDKATGSFALAQNRARPRAFVAGHDGLRAIWTARALERIGYEVLRVSAADLESAGLIDDLRVRVGEDDWQLVRGGCVQKFAALENVIRQAM